MKLTAISVTSTADPDPHIDPRFGRAEAFLVVDEAGRTVQCLANPHKDASHGAGPAVAGWMRDLGVGTIVSSEFGPKAAASLAALGIVAWLAPAGIRASEAHSRLVAGRLERKGHGS